VSTDAFDPIPILEALVDAKVDFVLIGGLAGGLHGSLYPTYDVDIMYARDRDNLERLAYVLRELGATLRGVPENVPFMLDAETLGRGANFTFATRRGAIDILAEPSGAPPYEKVRANAESVEISGRNVAVASLDHLIAMKEAAGRRKDALMASEYRDLADLRRQS
jgi:hypothetical protein